LMRRMVEKSRLSKGLRAVGCHGSGLVGVGVVGFVVNERRAS
jgi:hypothetical protein